MNEEFIREDTMFRIKLPISKAEIEHPFYAQPPNPPSAEAIKRAQFVDKTYHWNNADLRSGDKRTSK
jgi:hypothetical protein